MMLSLRHLILSVALLSVLFTLFSSISSGYRMSRQTLVQNTLETNRVYAQKLAKTTDVFFKMTLQTLEQSAKDIGTYIGSDDAGPKLLQEADRLKNQTHIFNSVVIADAKGEVLATSPQSLNIVGKYLDSPGGQQALSERRALVSKPYASITGRLIIFLSHPIFDEDGQYAGLVGGALYLKEENVLNDLLGEHFYKDGSYVYVVDGDGRIIYHQMQERVNDVVTENPVVQQLMQGNSGTARIQNTQNKDMLAGYAYIPTVEWGVVSQRPADISLAPTKDMMKEMIVQSLPYLLLSLIVIAFISKLIANPLQKLAYYTETSTEHDQGAGINKVKAWYYEAIQLKKALAYSLGFFQERVNYYTNESATDPLTKLANRRTMDERVTRWVETGTPFSIVIVDIDRFKRINDTYGHTAGDQVLQFLAGLMKDVSRDEDVCCRFGGEEFVLLLPDMGVYEAYQTAERLRMKAEHTVSPCGEIVTISAGIASFPAGAAHPHDVFELADRCLYEAKHTGRNKCVPFTDLDKSVV